MEKTIMLGEKLALDLRALASTLSKLADSVEDATPAREREVTADANAYEESTVPPSPESTAKPTTLEDVRAVLAEKSRAGHTAEVRELLQKHGAAKLSEIDPAKYAALLEDAEVLGDG